MSKEYKLAKDSLGEVKIPKDAMYGPQTQRAIENFQISSHKFSKTFIKSLLQLKLASAQTSFELKKITKEQKDAIEKSINKLLDEDFMIHFPLDIFQTGSGTSTNMNANEVISNYSHKLFNTEVHPNDVVNWGQSSNCIIPSAMSVSNLILSKELLNSVDILIDSLNKKSKDLSQVIKIGRTHLQDAVPMTFGQEFKTFANQVEFCKKDLLESIEDLKYIPIGGTAIGTGLASDPKFAKLVCEKISKITGIKFEEMTNKFFGIAGKEQQLKLAGSLNLLTSTLTKIANDLRLLSSGPNTGIGELSWKPLQPGSSVMPGKVNPVLAEMLIQVCAFIGSKINSIWTANHTGPLQLNMMMPLISFELDDSLQILTNAIKTFAKNGINFICVNKEKSESLVNKSASLITPLKNHPKIGYDLAAKIAKEAIENNTNIIDVLRSKNILSESEIKELLNPMKMVGKND